MDSLRCVVYVGGTCGIDFFASTRLFPCAIVALIKQDLIAEYLVVLGPLVAAALHHGLGVIVVGVKVAIGSVVVECSFSQDVAGPFADFRS